MPGFKGFSEKTISFFSHLSTDNSKQWFGKHRDDYENFVKKPATDYIVSMGEKLRGIVPRINAVPKINKSLFRINRDIRFSRDKTPYKTYLGIWFWDGDRKRMESSGFYFQLNIDRIMLGAGIYMFPNDLLKSYRNAVIDKKSGKSLKETVDKVNLEGYELGGRYYKKIPRGYDPSHVNAEYLLHKGLYAGMEIPVPEALFSKNFIEYSYEHFMKIKPLHDWLMQAVLS